MIFICGEVTGTIFLLTFVIIGYRALITYALIPIGTHRYRIPLLLCAKVIDALKTRAASECRITNTCNIVGDRYALKARTTSKRRRGEACNAIGNRYALKACAISEHPIDNACDSFGNNNARKS